MVFKSREGQRRVVYPEEQNCPFYPSPYRLNNKKRTFGKHFINVINELQTEHYIVDDVEMDPHTIELSFLDGKFPDNLGIVILEI
jgi:hypothetical protein